MAGSRPTSTTSLVNARSPSSLPPRSSARTIFIMEVLECGDLAPLFFGQRWNHKAATSRSTPNTLLSKPERFEQHRELALDAYVVYARQLRSKRRRQHQK